MKQSRHNRRAARRLAESCVFDILELRTLMSVVNVANFGAKPNDGVNDLPAIQAALNASQPGDTILFSGGTFDLSGFGNSGGDGLIVPSNRTYVGQNGAILRGHDTQGPQMHVTGDNVTISGLTFQDGGLKVDKGSNLNNNIVIDNNVFNTNNNGVNSNGITATSGLTNSRITNNYFTGVSGGFGILAFNWKNLTIANNEFVNIKAGVHMQGFGGSVNLLFEQNYFSGVRGGMGAEIVSNSSIDGCVFQDNYYENPNQGTLTHDQLLNFMAFSFPTPTCTNTIIRRNTVIAPQRPDGIGVRIGLETAGINCQVYDNYVVGCEWGITDADGTTPSSVTITNNRMSGAVNSGIRQDHPAAGRTLTQSNDNGNVQLTWDINRVKPGRNMRLPGTGTSSGQTSTPASPPASPPPASPPPPPPPPALPMIQAEPDVTYLSDLDWTTMVNYWGPAERDMSNGQQAAGDGKTITINGQSYAKGLGVHGGSDLQYQLDGQYSEFKTDIGVDDEVGTKGSVDFQVYLDGVLAYDSGTMTGNDGAKTVDLNVSGAQDLELVVTNAGDDYNYDHADWANARLVPVPPTAAPTDLTAAYNMSTGQMDLNWDDNASDETGVTVERMDGANGTYVQIANLTGANIQSYSDNSNLTAGTTYYYRVTAYKTGAISSYSNEASAQDPVPVNPPVVQPATYYLSDLPVTINTNGWGSAELDHSNGEQGAHDGHALTLNGVTYSKGIGVHANSDITYNLNGQYSTFLSDMGVDDEEGNNGSIDFQVWVDGVLKYDSGTMTGASATQSLGNGLGIDVTGAQQLHLVVTDAGDGINYDHGDWAGARLVAATSVPTVDLSSLTPVSATSGWGPFETNQSNGEQALGDGSVITLNGQTYDTGVGVHANSSLVYALNGQYTSFKTDVGIDDEVGSKGSVDFQVIVDGAIVFDSGVMTGASATQTVNVDVTGKQQLTLKVISPTTNIDYDHADWAGAVLTATA